MARKPAQLVGGKGPRQIVWDNIRTWHKQCGERFSYADVVPADVNADTARTYITSLERGGYLQFEGMLAREGKVLRNLPVKSWTLARDTGVDAPRVKRDGTPVTQGLAQEQMWRTLRMLKVDTNARELAAHASTPEVPVSPVAAGDYLRSLRHAGFLMMVVPSMSRGFGKGLTEERYRLSLNTGPRAPMVCRAYVVYDPNTDTTHPIERVSEEVAIYGK